ncbi:hypothetical protein TNCV_4282161 [Trichonephila clavipes]|nr:hypothetical protein TNCV_4282161 [Trichonephila clavipes]
MIASTKWKVWGSGSDFVLSCNEWIWAYRALVFPAGGEWRLCVFKRWWIREEPCPGSRELEESSKGRRTDIGVERKERR